MYISAPRNATSDARPWKKFQRPYQPFPDKDRFRYATPVLLAWKQLITGFAVGLSDGLIFLALHVAGRLAQRYFEMFGFYAVSIAGGMLSSASAVAAAGTAAAHRSSSANSGRRRCSSVAYEYSDRYSTGGKSRVSAVADDSIELCSLCYRCSWDRRHCLSRSVEVLMGFRFGVDLMRARRRCRRLPG